MRLAASHVLVGHFKLAQHSKQAAESMCGASLQQVTLGSSKRIFSFPIADRSVRACNYCTPVIKRQQATRIFRRTSSVARHNCSFPECRKQRCSGLIEPFNHVLVATGTRGDVSLTDAITNHPDAHDRSWSRCLALAT